VAAEEFPAVTTPIAPTVVIKAALMTAVRQLRRFIVKTISFALFSSSLDDRARQCGDLNKDDQLRGVTAGGNAAFKERADALRAAGSSSEVPSRIGLTKTNPVPCRMGQSLVAED
jgi:hypothetical protein